MNRSKSFFKKAQQNIIILFVLVILVLTFTILNPNYIKAYNLLSIVQSFVPYAIMAIGATFVIATGGIDLSVGTVCIASAVFAGKLYMSVMPLWLVIPLMIIVGALFGLLNGLLISRLKLPPFIVTLGTMMVARGISALFAKDPNIYYPTGSWYNLVFSNANGFPTGIIWLLLFLAIGIVLMYKTIIGRYTLAIGSNEEAAKLSGINVKKYKLIAYIISGMCAGIAGIFWSASFATIVIGSGSGFELDVIAGIYIGGTSSTGGVASIFGSVLGSLILVAVRSGLNFTLARFNVEMNSTYLTYVLTGVIVVAAVILDLWKKSRIDKPENTTSKKAKLISLITASGLTVGLAIASLVVVINANNQKNKTIAVVAKGQTHAFWLSVKSGCKKAADKYHYDFTFRAPDTETPENLPVQRELIQTGLSNGSPALVLSCIGQGVADLLEQAYDARVPVVSFDSGVWQKDVEALDAIGKNPICSTVVNDNYAASGMAADRLYESIRYRISTSEKYKIGVIQYDESGAAYQRSAGFVDRFNELVESNSDTKGRCEIIEEVKPGGDGNAYVPALESLYERGCSSFYLTAEPVVTQVYDAIQASGNKYNDLLFVGFDAGRKHIEWMNKDSGPKLLGAVAQNSPEIGYQAVEQAIFAVEGKECTKQILIPGIWYDTTNMQKYIDEGIVYTD